MIQLRSGSRGSQWVFPGPEAATALGNLLGRQILWLHHRPPASETLGFEAQESVFEQAIRVIVMHGKVESHCPVETIPAP